MGLDIWREAVQKQKGTGMGGGGVCSAADADAWAPGLVDDRSAQLFRVHLQLGTATEQCPRFTRWPLAHHYPSVHYLGDTDEAALHWD